MAKECILCGKCISVCPLIKATNREELGPRAKSDLSRLLKEQPELLKSKDVKALAGLCIGCHRCKAACSQGMNVPGLVSALRGAHPDLKSWLWKTWLSNTKLWSTASTAATMLPKKFQPNMFSQHLKMLAGLKGESGIEPFLNVESFPDTYRGEKMLLFAGCTATRVQGRWLIAALRLLDGLGVEVRSGKFKCCGGGLKSAGFADESTKLAKTNVAIWRAAGRPKMVAFCASCLSSLKGYEDIFHDEEEADLWKASLTPLSSLLKGTTFTVAETAPDAIGYHRPCHVDEGDSDFTMLSSALGERLTAVTKDECCGFGGLLRLAAPELGNKVNAVCWEKLAGPGTVLTGCSACATQLASSAPDEVRVGHWLETIGDSIPATIADANYGQCQD